MGRPRHDDILTPREWDVLDLVGEGLTNEQIAEHLGISLAGVKYYVGEIISKLGVSSRIEAVEAAGGRRRMAGWVSFTPVLRAITGAEAFQARMIAAVVAALLIGAGAVAWSAGLGGGPDEQGLATSEHVGLDVAPEDGAAWEEAAGTTPFANTILLTKTEPVDVGDQGPLLASLRRVTSIEELEAALTPETRLIVVDQSAAAEVEASNVVYRELKAGRAIMELNVCFEQVHFREDPEREDSYETVTEISPSGEVRTYERHTNEGRRSTCDSVPFLAGEVPQFGYRLLLSPEEVQASLAAGHNGWTTEAFVSFRDFDAFEALLTYFDDSSYPGSCGHAVGTGFLNVYCPR